MELRDANLTVVLETAEVILVAACDQPRTSGEI